MGHPFSCSLTFVCSVLLSAGQNSNDLVDRIVMPQHEMFTCQLIYQSLNLAFKCDWDVALFNVYRSWGCLCKSPPGTKGGSLSSRCLIKMDTAIKWTLGPVQSSPLLSFSGLYHGLDLILWEIHRYVKNLPWLKDSYVHQRVLCFNFRVYFFSVLMVVCYVIHLMIEDLPSTRDCWRPEQIPTLCFLSIIKTIAHTPWVCFDED